MIGIIFADQERAAIEEFFELFKTPWAVWRSGEHFDAVIVTRHMPDLPTSFGTSFLILCGFNKFPFDDKLGIAPKNRFQGCMIELGGDTLPIYETIAVFGHELESQPLLESNRGIVAVILDRSETRVVRLGFNPFAELQFLLTKGQPSELAQRPAIELHIDLLRKLLLGAGVNLVEVPPVPFGYHFACCLTHDIDFFGIRRHGLDRTTAGFLYRATMGSAIDLIMGRRTRSQVLRNWNAALSFPLVYLGLLPDFWDPLKDYRAIESDLRSTFYIVPFSNHGGISPRGEDSPERAVAYELSDLAAEIKTCSELGCEIGIHGLDAWMDVQAGLREKQKVARIVSRENLGIRMHWLYFDQDSPRKLEEAGFAYDSTFGYNDAIGYRAGTAQIFRFLGAETLLELPLIIQDTALFYPSRMNLAETEAIELCRSLINITSRFGGVLTINWHCRSLAPERLWDGFYRRLLSEIRQSGAWFATASEAMEWYRRRRRLQFRDDNIADTIFSQATPTRIPQLALRHWRARRLPIAGQFRWARQSDFTDSPVWG